MTVESANFTALLERFGKSMDGYSWRDDHAPSEDTMEEVRGLISDAGLTRHLAIYSEILAIDVRSELDYRASLAACEAFIAKREYEILDISAQIDRSAKNEFLVRDDEWLKMAKRALNYKRSDMITALRVRLHLMRDLGMTPPAPDALPEAENSADEIARLNSELRGLRARVRDADAATERERSVRIRQVDRSSAYAIALRRKLRNVSPELCEDIQSAAEAVQAEYDKGGATVSECLEIHGLGRTSTETETA